MDIKYQIGKIVAYRAFNKVNKIGNESNNQRSGKASTCDPYLISGTLCDFRSLCAFRFLDMCNNIVTIF
jgi:hypothetical protein